MPRFEPPDVAPRWPPTWLPAIPLAPLTFDGADLASGSGPDKVDFLVGLLAGHAADLGEPYTRHLGGKVRELRFHLLAQQTRVTYWLARAAG